MYGKIFEEIFDSSVMVHGGDTVYVFVAMIVLSDKEGYIRQHPAAFASRIGKDANTVRAAIANLEAPDPDSSTPDHNGRRIIPLSELTGGRENRGWFVVNKKKYKDLAGMEDRREATKNRVRKHRERNATVTPRNAQVTNSNACNSNEDVNADVNAVVSSYRTQTLSGATPDVSPPEKKNGKDYKTDAIEVLNFLNEKTGRAFRPSDTNLKLIVNRFKTGATVQDCKTVVARKHGDWAGNDKMWPYLRPATLFNATKFEQYLGECVIDDPAKRRTR